MRTLSKKTNKRGNISGLQGLLLAVIMFGLIGIIGAFFGLIQSEVDTELTANSYAANNSLKAQEAQGKIFDKLPLAGTVIIMVFILVMLLGVVGYFMAGRYTGGTVQ